MEHFEPEDELELIEILQHLELVEAAEQESGNQPAVLGGQMNVRNFVQFDQQNSSIAQPMQGAVSRLSAFQNLLKHTETCEEGENCRERDCAKFKQIMSHWNGCNEPQCRLCLSLNRFVNGLEELLPIFQRLGSSLTAFLYPNAALDRH